MLQEEGLVFETSEDVEVLPTFDALGLKEDLLRGVYAYGFERPSAVQQRAILPILKGRDVIVQSQSGTGKTCVFSLGALQTVNTSEREPQVLFLSPTRELAEQSQKVCWHLVTTSMCRCTAALVVSASLTIFVPWRPVSTSFP